MGTEGKAYILTCVTEESELTVCRAFATEEAARAAMARLAREGRTKLEGTDGTPVSSRTGERSAYAGNDARCLLFRITETTIER